MGHFVKARKLLEHAFHLDPYNVDILVSLGESMEGSWRVINEKEMDSKVSTKVSSEKSLAKKTDTAIILMDDLLLSAETMFTRALIVSPNLPKAGKCRDRLMPLVEEVDQRRFNNIDSKVRRFYQIPETNPGLRQAKLEHYFRHIYHTNAIEGNTLTLAQTRSILETRLAVGGKSLMEQNEVLGLDAALRYLNASLLRGKIERVTLQQILEIHQNILAFVDPSEAGRFRRTQVFIADHRPPTAELVPELMMSLLEWLNSDQLLDVHPVEVAALAHWKLVYIHPFYDGNGRTARLLMNFLLMRAGLPPAIVRVQDRPAYYEHLKEANDGDVRPFIRFIAACTERTIDDFLNAALGTQMMMSTEEPPLLPSDAGVQISDEASSSCQISPDSETCVSFPDSEKTSKYMKTESAATSQTITPTTSTLQSSRAQIWPPKLWVYPHDLPNVIHMGG